MSACVCLCADQASCFHWVLQLQLLNSPFRHHSRYIGALGARVICDNIPGLANKQRQLCQRHPDIMQAIGEGTKEWIRECQHQFRHHRWNCSTLDRDHTVFGRVLLRSKCVCVCVCPERDLISGPESRLHLQLIRPLILTFLTCYCLIFTFFLSVLSPSAAHICQCSVFIVSNGVASGLAPHQ